MIYVYFLLLIYSYFRGIRGCIRIITSYNYLSKRISSKRTKTVTTKFYILIPVLREQKIIEETIDHFLSIKGVHQVYLITTEKEEYEKLNSKIIPLEYKSMPTTKDVILKYLEQHPNTRRKIKLIHYPKLEGAMAHQLNFAINTLAKSIKDDDFVIIYNADSRIKSGTMERYQEIINNTNSCNCVLQSAVFLSNYEKLNPFLKSIALLQTRWTLAHEIPRILRSNSSLGFTEGAHVVGHGLCLRYAFLRKIGGFPQNYLNEDLPLGYFIRLSGARINLLKELENAETPSSIKHMFNQYRTWFYGLLYYPLYINKALRTPNYNKYLALIWGIKYIVRGIMWLNLSLVWFLLFLLPVLWRNETLFIFSLISFIIYAPLSFYLIYLTAGKEFGIHTELLPILISPFAYLTHSIGPFLAVYDFLKTSMNSSKIYKNKTER